jgi:2-oxoglutarate ferredoxin oxidoreductase subunit gamma
MTLIRIALAGEGGQGVQSIAEILAEAAYNEQKQTIYIPNFGLEQRGGVSVAFIQFSETRIGAPKFEKADVVIALSERAVLRTVTYSDQNTLFVYDADIQLPPEDFPAAYRKLLPVKALEIAKTTLHPRVFNVLIMGVVIGLTQAVSVAAAQNALEHKLAHQFDKDPQLRELNDQAMQIGLQLAQDMMKGVE